MATQTIKQYIGSLRRICPGVEYQVNAWPYPQAEQSHIAIWQPGTREFGDALGVYLINSDCPGALMRIRPGQPKPAEIARKLAIQ